MALGEKKGALPNITPGCLVSGLFLGGAVAFARRGACE